MNITPVPNVFFDDTFSEIPPSEVKLYLALLHLSLKKSQVQAAVGELVKFTGLAHPTIQKCRENLIQRKFLEILESPRQHSPTIFGVLGGGCSLQGNVIIMPLPRNFDRHQVEGRFWRICFDGWLNNVVTPKRDAICQNMRGTAISPGTHAEFFYENIAPKIKQLTDQELWVQYCGLSERGELPDFIRCALTPFDTI